MQTTAQLSQVSSKGLVRIIPKQQSKNTFLLKKSILLLWCAWAVPSWSTRRHCGSREANRQAPRSLARRWLGSRYPLLRSLALALSLWEVASSHVLAALVPAALRISPGRREACESLVGEKESLRCELMPTTDWTAGIIRLERWWILHTLPCKAREKRQVRDGTFFLC